jgi:ABC-type branched-subunit amino acid transport system substrate-binding protein
MLMCKLDRRKLVMAATVALLAGCKAVPHPQTGARPGPGPNESPSAGVLPTDAQRHRVALLLPLSGPNGAVGQSIANATTMALLDTNAQNLRITTYDTSASGAGTAAGRAIADGNMLILGPLMSEDIPAVVATARAARVPVVSYSNDESRASRDVFIMGNLPGTSVARTVSYARSLGLGRFAALVPAGEYGQRASAAFTSTVRAQGGTVVAMEPYDRSAASVTGAAQRLRTKGGYEAVLIADGGRISAAAAPVLRAQEANPQILGTELWSGESVVGLTPAMRGALYSAVADTRFRQFADSYRTRFGGQPYRISTLGYDSVLLTLRVARDWKPGSVFPTAKLYDRGGFLGLDGAFRFGSNGAIERALEVRKVRAGGVDVVSPAPARFED